jgi:hypothetical protein
MPDENTVCLKYYGHTLVEWHADDTFRVFHVRGVTAYSVDDMTGFLPSGVRFEWIGRRLFICFLRDDGLVRYEMKPEHPFMFVRMGERFELTDRPKAVRFVRKRNAVQNLLRERYGAFLDWASVVNSVSSQYSADEGEASNVAMRKQLGIPSAEEYENICRAHLQYYNDNNLWEDRRMAMHLPFIKKYENPAVFYTPAVKLLDEWLCGTPDQWVLALNMIAMRSGRYVWGNRGNEPLWKLDTKTIYECLIDLASHLFRDELFVCETLPDGATPSRTNLSYWNTFEFTDIPKHIRIVSTPNNS